MTTHSNSRTFDTVPLVSVTNDSDRAAVWTRHWATGTAHSCVGSYGDLYGGAVASFWRQALSSLQTGQRVLDIATGNGALPRLLLDIYPELEVEIDAVDIAAVAPQWIGTLGPQRRRRVRFFPGQAAEALPFPSQRFDLVISQYGLEYSDLDHSVPELIRVLAPGGRIAMLLHHANSRPVQLASLEIQHIEWLQSPQGLLHAAEVLFEPMSRSTTAEGRASLAADPVAESAREQFNAAQDALRARAALNGGDGTDVLFEIQNAVIHLLAMAVHQGAIEARRQWQAVISALTDMHLRLEELRRHALPHVAIDELLSRLNKEGLQVTAGCLHEGPHLMGWSIATATSGSVFE